jgi:hypothetical protein
MSNSSIDGVQTPILFFSRTALARGDYQKKKKKKRKETEKHP